jgi:hypothetical protein
MILVAIGCCVRINVKREYHFVASSLLFFGNFLSVYVGLEILDYDISYTQVLIDYLIGMAVMAACTIPCCICAVL